MPIFDRSLRPAARLEFVVVADTHDIVENGSTGARLSFTSPADRPRGTRVAESQR